MVGFPTVGGAAPGGVVSRVFQKIVIAAQAATGLNSYDVVFTIILQYSS